MTQKVLITGITGFAGSFLAEHLLGQSGQYKISGTYLTETSIANVAHIKKDLNLISLNLLHKDKVSDLISKIKPDLIFHLAALSSPSDSFKSPAETITNNVVAQINLLEAVRAQNLTNSKILITSSADIYGIVEEKNLPIDEETAFMPANPYAVSKITQDFLAWQYFISYKLNIIRVRPFNHIGPRQAPGFVVSDFAKRIAYIEKGLTEPILRVGNLAAKRDFTDVRDMTGAYMLALEKGKAGDVYNIGSGYAYSIEEILNILLSMAKLKITVKKDSLLIRPSDTPKLICNSEKFVKATGWKPVISLTQTLKDTLDYWRNIV
ncbi:GDP-mannose 4,6-dehydratase [Candidatus Microgenomates bacterium]|nr:GDP-mannose 4,6-dehydratase [Candidatus Microgenomates bacterium]